VQAPRSLAGVAQLVEQLICNQQVAGSSPIASYSLFYSSTSLESPIYWGGIPEWPKGAGCKPAGSRLRRFESSSLHHDVSRDGPRRSMRE
jgi:hypothetical protein